MARNIATIAKIKNAQRLAAVDRAAAAHGLKPGMALADARAILPDLRCFAADAAREAATLASIADWCRCFTPLAALDAPDGVMLDVTGATHLFGGEAKLLVEIETRLAAQGFAALAGVGPTSEAAWALARFGKEPLMPAECSENIACWLGPLPLAALRLDEKTLADLAQAGLRRIDDILLRPRAPLAARFGIALFERLDAMFGRTKTPISPRFEAPLYLAERRSAEPISRRETIQATIFALAQELARLLARHGEGIRRLDLSLYGIDGRVRHIGAGTSRPLRDPRMIARLFHEKLEAACATEGENDPLDAGFGFDVLRLSALSVERLDEEQENWIAPAASQDLADLIDHLGARLGLRRVTRFSLVDRHWPEFAVTSVPAASGMPTHLARPLPATGERELRPIRLLSPPEPIETIASVPDGPPMQFRWRRVLHEIAAIEGPERIASEWWKNVALTRDYFCAEDKEGRRFWLFREGLYETECTRPRWFMHGLFT